MARILSRHVDTLSPWTRLVRKEVLTDSSEKPETYHSLAQADYIAILASLPDGRIPIVRQFRSAVDRYTWELPAGLLDDNESPEVAAVRELKEETGLDAIKVTPIGSLYADTGRLENRIYTFYIETSAPDPNFKGEVGVEVDFVLPEVIIERIQSGDFCNQMHLGVLMQSQLAGFRPV